MTNRALHRINILILTSILSVVGFAQDPSGRDVPAAPKKAEPAPTKKPAEKKSSEKKPTKTAEKSSPKSSSPSSSKPALTKEKPASKSASASSSKPVPKVESKTSKAPATSKPASSPSRPAHAVRLTITAPPGAMIELDGKPRGFAGIDGNLVMSGIAAGDHQLSVTADGHEPWSGTFVMSTSSTTFKVPMVRKPATGKLALTANQPGTEILIDEKYSIKAMAGQTMHVDELLPGPRQLRAIKPGFEEWRGTVTVRPNETILVRIEMRPILNPEMIPVPEGSFFQGTETGEKDQRPPHQVVTNAFEISRCEVTNRFYKSFIDATGHPSPQGTGYGWIGNNYPEGHDDFPVVFVSWEDAMAFTKWLSLQTKKRYRLPTEAEWEKAARLVGDQYSSVGKIWEWCMDWYDPDYYKRRDRLNPQGPAAGRRVKLLGRDGEARVMRGGGFGQGSILTRAAERDFMFPNMGRFDIGFRIVREVQK